MSDHSRDDATQVAEQFKTDLEQITVSTGTKRKRILEKAKKFKLDFLARCLVIQY